MEYGNNTIIRKFVILKVILSLNDLSQNVGPTPTFNLCPRIYFSVVRLSFILLKSIRNVMINKLVQICISPISYGFLTAWMPI